MLLRGKRHEMHMLSSRATTTGSSRDRQQIRCSLLHCSSCTGHTDRLLRNSRRGRTGPLKPGCTVRERSCSLPPIDQPGTLKRVDQSHQLNISMWVNISFLFRRRPNKAETKNFRYISFSLKTTASMEPHSM